MPAPAIAAPIAALNVSKRTIVGFGRVPAPSRSSHVDQAFSRLLPWSSCSRLWRSRSSIEPIGSSVGLHTGNTVSLNNSRSASPRLPGLARRMARSRPSPTRSGASSMARTCHCTDGCSAAKTASRGASHSDATDPLAEIDSIGRTPRARSRTESQAVASCAKPASTARSSDSPSAVTAVRVWPAPLRARVSSVAPSDASSPRTWWLTALVLTCSASAARAKLPWRATAANERSAASGGMRSDIAVEHNSTAVENLAFAQRLPARPGWRANQGRVPVHFDLRLWRMTAGLRWRIALGIALGLLALAVGIARFAFLGQFLARLFRGATGMELAMPLLATPPRSCCAPGWITPARCSRTAPRRRCRRRCARGCTTRSWRWAGLVRRRAHRRRDAVDGRRRRAVADLLRAVYAAGIDRRLRAARDLRLHGVVGRAGRHRHAGARRCSPWCCRRSCTQDRRASRARQRAFKAFGEEFLDAVQGLPTLKAFGQSGRTAACWRPRRGRCRTARSGCWR